MMPSRRSALLLAGALSALSGCASAPKPAAAPVVVAPPPVVEPALELTGLKVDKHAFSSAELTLSGKVGAQVEARELSWTAKLGDREVATGKTALAGAGEFSAPVSVTLGSTLADFEGYKSADHLQLTVEARLGDATETRAAQLFSPRMPEAKVVQVQASDENGALAMTFHFAVKNPNNFELVVDRVDYALEVMGKGVAKDSLPSSRIPGAGDFTVDFPGLLNEAAAGGAKEFKALIAKRTEYPWTLKGTIKLAGLELPFTQEGVVKLSAPITAPTAPTKGKKK